MKNLIEITESNDSRRVYTMGIGVTWDDLTDEEKKELYTSEVYLTRKTNMQCSELSKELESVTDTLILLLRKLSPGIVIRFPWDDE